MTSDLASGALSPTRKDSAADQAMPDDRWIAAHYERIHRSAWLMTGDAWEAEDLAQETFVIAIDRWDRFEGQSSRATWLYGILLHLVRRRARTLARLRKRIQRYVFQREPLVSEDPQIEFAKQQWRDSVWAEVAKLPESQREAVALRFAEEMSYEEIAHVTGCAVGTAKSRVHHGLKRLRTKTDQQPMMPPRSSALTLTASK